MRGKPGSTYDVIVIGAGPAGCAAALSAKHQGAGSVLLLEKERIPRIKICAGGITPWSVLALKECGFPSGVLQPMYPITGAEVVTGKGKPFEFSGTFTAGVILRNILDQNLAAAAVEQGIVFRDQTPVTNLLFDGIRTAGVQTTIGPIESRHVIVANGGMSHFHQDLRKRTYTATMLARYDRIEHNSQTIKLFFDRRIKPYFGWWFPESPGSFNVGMGVDKQVLNGTSMKELFKQFTETHFGKMIKGREPVFTGSFPILAHPKIEHHPFPGTIVAGEANRLVHTFSGEGIACALHSGRFAGEAIARGIQENLTDSEIELLYLKKLKKRFDRYMSSSYFLRKHGIQLLNSTRFLVGMKPVKNLVVRSLGCS